jgi:hypothetical protein
MEVIEGKLLLADGDIDFQNIPQTYKHLMLRASLRTAEAAIQSQVFGRFNNDAGATSYQYYGVHVSAANPVPFGTFNAAQALLGYACGTSAEANFYPALLLDILDYADTARACSFSFRSAFAHSGGAYQYDGGGFYRPVGAVSRLQLFYGASFLPTFKAGSRATLYGIRGENPAVALAAAGASGVFCGAKVYDVGGQVIATGAAAAAVNMDSEEFDSDGFHDNVTNNTRLTVPAGKAGKYLCYANLLGSGHSNTTQIQAELRKNGAVVAVDMQQDTGGVSHGFYPSTVLDLAVGDYVEVYGYKAGGASNMTLSGGAAYCHLGMHRVGI